MALTAGQVTVDATVGGVVIVAASTTDGRTVTLKNADATATNTAVIGPSGVAVGTGLALAGGETITFTLNAGEAVYGIRGTANSVVVHYLAT